MKRNATGYAMSLGAALLLGAGCIAPALAQGGPPGGGFGGRRGGGNNPIFAMFRNVVDPTRNSETQLLQRTDVQTALELDVQQKNAINGLEDKTQADLRAQMDTMRQSLRGQRDPNQSQEDRQAQRDEMRQQMQAKFAASQDELDKGLQGLLKPEQYKRLKELDLQWRGPLALSDPKVASQFTLGTDEQAKVTAAVNAYRETTNKSRQEAFSGMNFGRRNRQADPSAPAPAPPSQEEMQQRATQFKKDLEKARKQGGADVLAALTPDNQQHWAQLTGRPFHFRDLD